MVDFQDAPDKAIGMMKQKKFILVSRLDLILIDLSIILCTGM